MQASAAAAGSTALPEQPSAEPNAAAVKGEGAGVGGSRHAHMGSAWSKGGTAGGDAGNAWVEVYCASAAGGRWVPVDPLMGWVDRCCSTRLILCSTGSASSVMAHSKDLFCNIRAYTFQETQDIPCSAPASKQKAAHVHWHAVHCSVGTHLKCVCISHCKT